MQNTSKISLFARLATLFAALFFLSVQAGAQTLPAPTLAAKTWLLIDYATGQPLAASNPDQRVEPASLTKLMTAYLTFAALRENRIKPDQIVPVSEKAWRAEGSRMFIDPKQTPNVDQLIHGMIIQSGNDACIALAELIAGSEDTFVAMMNRQAQRLGLTGTHYMNATGLTDAQHYTTARDLSKLAQAIIRDFPEYYPIYSQKEYRWNNITQPNRNRLLWLDPTVDGMKTGHTKSAGFCLISTSKRGPRRLISVVLGTDSEDARAQESLKLLNYGYLGYDAYTLYRRGQHVSELKVFKGAANTVGAGFAEDFILSLPKGVAPDRLKVQMVSKQPLLAPVAKGTVVGTLRLTLDGQPYGEHAVYATDDVPLAGFIGRSWDSVKMLFQ